MRSARIDTYKTPPLPEIETGEYLCAAFLALNAGELLTWTEIHAYSQLCGGISEPWEAEIIRGMSSDYLAGRKLGEDPFSIPPYEFE
jgi:hypothetical protein